LNDNMNEATQESSLSATGDAAMLFAPRSACDCTDVAAYLDGELSVAESETFEGHLASCRTCADALSEQRRLLCLLDVAFSRAQRKVELPEDFVRVVKARAQTDMTSVRGTSERRRAALVVVALALVASALLGGRVLGGGIATLGAAAGAALSIFDMIFHTLAEAMAGLLFILRGVGRHLATEPGGVGALVLLLLACSLAALLRLVSDYHRERLPD
jgi:hypothetical protein